MIPVSQDASSLSIGDIVYVRSCETYHPSGLVFHEEHEVAVRNICFAVDSWVVEASKLNVYGYFKEYPENGRFLPFAFRGSVIGYLLDQQTYLIPRPAVFDGVPKSNYNPSSAIQVNYSDKFKLVENMRKYGGNFVSRLADALVAADPQNTKRIIEAFPDIVEKYSR
jgi:hypothetical protein